MVCGVFVVHFSEAAALTRRARCTSSALILLIIFTSSSSTNRSPLTKAYNRNPVTPSPGVDGNWAHDEGGMCCAVFLLWCSFALPTFLSVRLILPHFHIARMLSITYATSEYGSQWERCCCRASVAAAAAASKLAVWKSSCGFGSLRLQFTRTASWVIIRVFVWAGLVGCTSFQ